jgi:hypothetical protein
LKNSKQYFPPQAAFNAAKKDGVGAPQAQTMGNTVVPVVVAPVASPGAASPAAKMEQVQKMADEGLITQEQADAKKQAILDSM